MATVINLCNYELKFYHLVSFTHFKPYSKNQDHMYNGKLICTFVVLPHKPRFQAETWIREIMCGNGESVQ